MGPRPFVMPDDNLLLRQFPNHWVVLLNEVTLDPAQENASLTIWTWGGVLKLSTPRQVLLDNYFGAVIAKL